MSLFALSVPALAAAAPEPDLTGTVRGRITDRGTGTSLVGVQVQVVGTRLGAMTDAQGRYVIAQVPAGAQSITARMLGFAPETRALTVTDAAETTADFSLSRMATQLGEVVVTATGDQRKVEIGNAVATLRIDSIVAAAPVTSVGELLQGRVAGLLTFSNSGVTGSSPRIRIRGFNSLARPNNPLMIIDGARVENTTGAAGGNTNIASYGWTAGSVSAINPEEIESFEIVKGPAAATLYGTDAANGVIVIRTKRGQQGPARLTIYGEGGMILGPTRWNTNYYAFGKTPAGNPINCVNLARSQGQCTLDSVSAWSVMRDAPSSPVGTGERAQLGTQISGGAQGFRYFLSGDHERETGYLELPKVEITRIRAQRGGAEIPDEQIHPNYLRRTSLRGNVSTSVGTKAEYAVASNLLFQKSQIPGTQIFSDAAWGPGYKDAFDGWNAGRRPGESFAIRSSENLIRMTTSVNGTVTPLSWLTFRGIVGVDASSNFSDNLQRRGEGGTAAVPSLGRRNETRAQTVLYTGDLGASASFNLSPSLTSRTSVGGQYNRRDRGAVSAIGTNLPPGSSTLAGAAAVQNLESTLESVVAGAYVEQNLGWKDRVFVTGAVRADGASSFGKNFRTANYPKVSLSWLASSEEFFPQSNLLTSLRYRLAYGASGVQPAADAALPRLLLSTVFVNGTTNSAAQLQTLGNPNLKPEYTWEVETGFDAELWRGRWKLESTVYQKQSRDALVQRAYPRSLGVLGTGQLDNVGAVRNRGIEGMLSGTVYAGRGAELDISVNGSINRSTLTSLDPTTRPPEDRFIKFVEGYPLFGQWDRKVRSYADANGNGLLERNEVIVDDSITYLGVTNPTHLLNVTPSLTLFNGQLRLSSMFVYKGNYIQTNFSEANKCNIGGCRARNDPHAPLRDQAAYVAISGPSLTYAGYAEDGTFTRWAEASVTWEAGTVFRRWVGQRKATFSLSARNLGLWTGYSGVDPEVTQNPELTGNFGTLWDLGYDNPVSPQPRVYILRVTFGY
ncbi:MAG: SusC/RagA family TonB-linked outer membrane protein [Gemmatimonadaceae bacterium]